MLITGASGFTGQHACEYFKTMGMEVYGVVNNGKIETKDVHEIRCDLSDKEAIETVIKDIKPHYLLHLAGQNEVKASWENPIESFEINTFSTLYLLEALRKHHPATKIVIVGSALQSDLSKLHALPHPYSLTKTMQIVISRSWEKLFSLDITIVKPSNLIGPGRSNGVCGLFAEKIAKMEQGNSKEPLQVSNPNAERDFLDVRDAVDAYGFLFEKGSKGEVYDIASGNSRTLKELIDTLKQLTPIVVQVDYQDNSKKGDPVRINTKKISELGWKPRISFNDSVQDSLNFFRSEQLKR